MYEFHKKEFCLEDNTFLRLFEELLSEPSCSVLECSAEISPDEIHGARLRLGYQERNIRQGLEAIYGFLSGIERHEGVRLNREILGRIVDKELNLSKILQVGIGLDYRKEICDSKVKYYCMLAEYPEKVNQVLSLHPPVETIDGYLNCDEFMFGINMDFSGITSVEIYPLLRSEDLLDSALVEKLNLRNPVLTFIEECSGLHISFHPGGERILHFHPRNPTRFVHLIGNRRLSVFYSNVQILRFLSGRWKIRQGISTSISLKENEIISRNIQNTSLQYALSYGAGYG
jgi:LynF/TruF/PatF family peptide O-prenyltransferase